MFWAGGHWYRNMRMWNPKLETAPSRMSLDRVCGGLEGQGYGMYRAVLWYPQVPHQTSWVPSTSWWASPAQALQAQG